MVKGPTSSHALLILFPGFNTLDVNGPFETFRQVKYGKASQEMFQVTVAAEEQITVSAEGARMERNRPIDNDLLEELGNYDMLIVPGGTVKAVEEMISNSKSPFHTVIQKYANLPQRSDSLPKILLSICTGALFLGKLGIFNGGRYCTTHWGAYKALVEYNNEAVGSIQPTDQDSTKTGTGMEADLKNERGLQQPGIVIPARFVDSGVNTQQIRIITSGGISCGIDASLHIIRIRAELLAGTGSGEGIAAATAKVLDYPFRFTEGVIFDEDF